MTESNYYIPDISDIFVGYQCEVFGQSTTKLIKKTEFHNVEVSFHMETGSKIGITQIPNLLKKGWIRTKYLSKEDLENEGWDMLTDNKSNYGFIKNKSLCYFWKGSIPYVEIYPEEGYNTQYQGVCKSVNEFRKLCKMLEI